MGTDESFFEDDGERKKLFDLYHEHAGILDGDADGEIDALAESFERAGSVLGF